jgi:hypothetical protein
MAFNGSKRVSEDNCVVVATHDRESSHGNLIGSSSSTATKTRSRLCRSALDLWMPCRMACCRSLLCFFRSLNSSGCVTVMNWNIIRAGDPESSLILVCSRYAEVVILWLKPSSAWGDVRAQLQRAISNPRGRIRKPYLMTWLHR